MREREYVGKSAAGYDLYTNSAPDPAVDKASSLFPEGSLILDLGSGDGRNAHFLSELGHKVVAMELERDVIKDRLKVGKHMGGRAVSGVLDLQADLHALPFKDETFDVVVSTLALQHIEIGHPRKDVIKDIQRVTKPSGINVIASYFIRDHEAGIHRLNPLKEGEAREAYEQASWEFSYLDENYSPLRWERDYESGEDKCYVSSLSRLVVKKPPAYDADDQLRRQAEYYRRTDPEYADYLLSQLGSTRRAL